MMNLNERMKAYFAHGKIVELWDECEDAMLDVVAEYLCDCEDAYTIAKDIKHVILDCNDDNELRIANDMFCAIFGWSLDTFFKDVERKIADYDEEEN